MSKRFDDKIQLNNDVLMPQHGFGVYLIDGFNKERHRGPDPDEMYSTI
ncbi:hypothetical protein ACIQD3_24300 [Peribacillus loiseleuriae]